MWEKRVRSDRERLTNSSNLGNSRMRRAESSIASTVIPSSIFRGRSRGQIRFSGSFAGSDPFFGFLSEAKSKAPLQNLSSHCEELSIIPKMGFQTEPLLILVQTGLLLF